MNRTMVAAIAVLMGTAAGAVAQPPYGAVANQSPAGGGWGPRGWGGPTGPDAAVAPAVARPPLPPLYPDLHGPDRYDARDWRPDDAGSRAFAGNYVRPYRGWAVPSYFVTPAFFVRDARRFGLARPGPGRNWVRYYDDAVLVGPDGRVDDVRYDVDWNGADGRGPGPGPHDRDRAYDAGYDDGYDDAGDRGPGWIDDRVTYGGAWGGRWSGARAYPPGSVVVVRDAPAVATTTTTTVTEDVVYRRTARRAPVRRAVARPGKYRPR